MHMTGSCREVLSSFASHVHLMHKTIYEDSLHANPQALPGDVFLHLRVVAGGTCHLPSDYTVFSSSYLSISV